jgi:hypothetical protein
VEREKTPRRLCQEEIAPQISGALRFGLDHRSAARDNITHDRCGEALQERSIRQHPFGRPKTTGIGVQIGMRWHEPGDRAVDWTHWRYSIGCARIAGASLNWLTRSNLETGIDLWNRLKGRAMARRAGYFVLAAVALETDVLQLLAQAAFAAFGIVVTPSNTPHFVAIAFAAMGGFLLILDRILAETRAAVQVNPHDLVLIKRVRELFDQNMQIFLRDEDFGTFSIEYAPIGRLHHINYVWRGPEFEFIEPRVQEKWSALRASMKEFGHEVATHTWPTEMGRDHVTVYSRNEYPESRSERTEERINKLNDLATTVIERFYEMDALARRNIPVTDA